MYAQITTRCDMACPHCCFGCRPGIGIDMTFDTFTRAIRWAQETGQYMSIGGGEPTLHPQFWRFLGHALDFHREYCDGVGFVGDSGIQFLIVTNGSQTKTALRLARLCEEGRLDAVLSRDEFHDPIDARVVRAFESLRRSGKEGVRNNSNYITPHGSALKNGIYTDADACCCPDPLVSPKGTIWGCGCRKVKFGTVLYPKVPTNFEWGTCALQQPNEEPIDSAAD